MGYLDGLVAPLFKTDEQGRDVFFPWGIYGKGRVLPDEATATRLRGKMKTMYVAMIIAIVPLILVGAVVREIYDGSIAMELLVMIPIALLLGGIMQANVFSHLRGLPMSDQSLTLNDVHQTQAKSFGMGWLVALALISAVFFIGGVFLMFAAPADLFWSGVLFTAIFGACLLLYIRMIILKKKQ